MTTIASSRHEPFASRTSPAMIGLWIFIATEALFFGMLIASYLYLRVRAGAWPPPGAPEIDLLVPALNTVVLLSSGLTMHGAHAAMRRGDSTLLRAGIVATIVLGAAFLGGQAYEYAKAGFGLSSGLLGSAFFTLTGFHGAHVFAGLVFLILILARASRGHYSDTVISTGRAGVYPPPPGVPEGPGGGVQDPALRVEQHAGVESCALYWHFVDAVWVVLFTILYLI